MQFFNEGRVDSLVNELERKQIMRIALFAGEIMLRSGGETYRVEDTIVRICRCMGIKHIQAFVTPTVIIIANYRADGFSFMKTIHHRSTDLKKISLVNDFSRDLQSCKISVQDAMAELRGINGIPQYPKWSQILWSGIASGSFALLFGGSPRDFFAAFVIAMVAMGVSTKIEKLSLTSFLANIAAGAVISTLAIMFLGIDFGDSLDMIIVGSIMPFLPGVSFTNGIRDFISGDLMSGASRVSEAILVAISIAVGVGSILQLWIKIGGLL